jgi:hypothetical protein
MRKRSNSALVIATRAPSGLCSSRSLKSIRQPWKRSTVVPSSALALCAAAWRRSTALILAQQLAWIERLIEDQQIDPMVAHRARHFAPVSGRGHVAGIAAQTRAKDFCFQMFPRARPQQRATAGPAREKVSLRWLTLASQRPIRIFRS